MKSSIIRVSVLLKILLFTSEVTAQSFTQTVRGTVTDKLSRETLIGASVILIDTSETQKTICDLNGNFRIENVSVGRKVLYLRMIGYKEMYVPIVVTSGKEVIVNAEMEQSVIEGKEVTIVAERRKDKPNNEMTTVSARSFTVEETSRYAGSLLDPARMAMNYAGVSGANDARNDIIIRGNSPLGLLWRLNGIDIPNPNHFGSLGVTGGPISILNNNSLDKSDFLTGAFPAEYGNAIAGAFDLQMRSGNNEKHEFLGQVGFNGFEIGAEGPFNRRKNSSYIINYRYSTLGVFHSLGIDLGTGNSVPQYQDVSFKLDFSTKKGKLSVFGIGGISYAEVLDKDRDTTKDNIYNSIKWRQDGYFGTNMGVLGISYLHFFDNSTYSKFSLAASTGGQDYKIDSIVVSDNTPFPWYRNNSNQQKYTLSYIFNKKFSSKDYLKTGWQIEHIVFDYRDSILNEHHIFRTINNSEGSSDLIQTYAEWQHKFSDYLSINAGIHFQLFTLNNSNAFEPRFGIKWEMNEGESLSFGTGIHSQLQPMFTYFQETKLAGGGTVKTNKNLGMTKSNHFVLAYDKLFTQNIRLKIETYYQHVYDVPVEIRPTFFSLLNEGADFGVSSVDSLVNQGTGKNYGVEITLEKFYSKGYYFLVTGSFFESKYKGSDGIERNTAFNGNYTVNVLAGKEWTIKSKNVFAFNVRTVGSGGKRYVPIDFTASQLSGETKYNESQAYQNRQKDYFRTDIKISYRINKKHVTHEIALDIDNIFNTKNIWQKYYDSKSNTIRTEYQIGLFPVPLYRITF
jgi:hypothetical protein